MANICGAPEPGVLGRVCTKRACLQVTHENAQMAWFDPSDAVRRLRNRLNSIRPKQMGNVNNLGRK